MTERQFQHQLAKRLRELREDAGLSQADMARKMGVSKQMMQRLENSPSNPRIRTLLKVAGALGVELGDLLSFICKS